jgi:molybdopterin synthase catalytic subunit
MIRDIRIQQANFDPGAELARVETSGAVASFTGLVRGDGGLTTMTLEHYPGMTEAALVAIAAEAEARWLLTGLILVHRIGQLAPGNRIVLVATASPHRAAALEACAFLIDRLKTDAPFWKKESFADGRENWVDARESDDEAAGRWALGTQTC